MFGKPPLLLPQLRLHKLAKFCEPIHFSSHYKHSGSSNRLGTEPSEKYTLFLVLHGFLFESDDTVWVERLSQEGTGTDLTRTLCGDSLHFNDGEGCWHYTWIQHTHDMKV